MSQEYINTIEYWKQLREKKEQPKDLHQLSKWTLFPSTRAVLEAGFSCREAPQGKVWAIYWMEFGTELTLFPGDEGPQEANDIDEIIEWIGGDQPCYLTPASPKRLGVQS